MGSLSPQVEDYLAQLAVALREYRFADVTTLNRQVSVAGFNERQVRRTLSMLRKKRRFADLEMMAGLFASVGTAEMSARRQVGQALLDQGRVDQGLDFLCALRSRLTEADGEWSEVQGLIGRAYKQRFVMAGDPKDLVAAIDAYLPCWLARRGDYRWHGINVVALAARASRDGIDIGAKHDFTAFAKDILSDIAQLDEPQVWDAATALEAAVALGDQPAARSALKEYVLHSMADAFELGSTLRQLKEIWQLDRPGDPFGSELLPPLEYAVLTHEGGVAAPTPSKNGRSINAAGFEAIYGPESYVHIAWMETLLQCCASIARLSSTRTGTNYGTGFLLPPQSVGAAAGGTPVLMTNAHVVSTTAADQAALRPEDASAEFTRLPGRPRLPLGPLLFSSPRHVFDASICRLDVPTGATALPVADILPSAPQAGNPGAKLYVIGHPGGGDLAVSLYDNSLIGFVPPMVHYRCPTEGGSSGSPVLTTELRVFALHHRSRADLGANEGVCLSSIFCPSKD